MQTLIQQIIDWANERNLINGSTPYKQGLKLMSEYGELCDSIVKNDLDGIKDGIGDVAVVAIIISIQTGNHIAVHEIYPYFTHDKDLLAHTIDLAEDLKDIISDNCYVENVLIKLSTIARYYNLTLKQCLQHAYDEIKDRKGIMYDGVFIKETDPRYEQLVKE